jgi:phytanoyl-CoA hydroxylase
MEGLQMSQTPTMADFYRENGYYMAKGVFDKSEIQKLEASFDRIVAQIQQTGENVNARWGGANMQRDELKEFGHPVDSTVIHTHQVQQYSSDWLHAFLQEKFLGIANELLGDGGVVLHHSKLFLKPPRVGSAFTIHQDWSYFPTKKDSMLAAIIHVSKATDEMGCLSVYPGSHKLGRVADSGGWVESEVLSKFPLSKAQVLEAEPGDVLFFSYFLLHGSKPNVSDSDRKTVLVQLFAGNDEVEDGVQHPNQRLVLKGWNSEMTRNKANS